MSLATPAVVGATNRVCWLQENLARITDACTRASARREPGQLYILLRKKWRLMQELFEAENQLRLLR